MNIFPVSNDGKINEILSRTVSEATSQQNLPSVHCASDVSGQEANDEVRALGFSRHGVYR